MLTNEIKVQIGEGLEVSVIRDEAKEWVMSTRDVAKGYGVSPETIRSNRHYNQTEFVEGTHYIRGTVGISNAGQSNHILWTKAGVVRLGFCIKSERAKMFRDWAERIVLAVSAPVATLPKAKRVNHNRLSKDRLVELLSLVALVEDKSVRVALVQKLMPDLDVKPLQLTIPFIG